MGPRVGVGGSTTPPTLIVILVVLSCRPEKLLLLVLPGPTRGRWESWCAKEMPPGGILKLPEGEWGRLFGVPLLPPPPPTRTVTFPPPPPCELFKGDFKIPPLAVLADVGADVGSRVGLLRDVLTTNVGLSFGPSIDVDRGLMEKWLVWAGVG